RVRWDGIDTATADRHQLFSSVALLAQNFQRWSFTLRANLLLGRPEVPCDQRQLETAADYADLHPVIEELPHSWDTLIAKGFEGGVGLSGGQWQKVALARTHLRLTTPDAHGRLPALVVVDEPTSAMDPETEVETFEQIRQLTGLGVTVILITHRLGATAKADHIVVLDHGRLIEQGSHAELMAQEPATRYRESYLL
ncbi:ABC transporter ATP-binding protein, partial [Kitasatospora sp. NPDC004669]|uniref:ABC transporter ATP-binding protein n=1 Tax=Kitasatospora sp. NPDC004669 TaxID=3154555 RepID=UPI0033AA6AC6